MYRQLTVRLNGQGVVLRNVVSGAELSGSRRLLARGGQFVMSKIDARNGALGIVPPHLDGAVVSSDFPVFDVDQTQLLPAFLGWLSRTRGFVDRCRASSEGTTNRVRLKEDRFLALTVSLPPLDEQRRIVARIEELAAKVEEARGVRGEIVESADGVCRSILLRSAGTNRVSLRELVRLRRPDVSVQPDTLYEFAGVYCFGRGVFRGPRKTGAEFAYERLTRIRTGDFLYPKLMAWEGAFGIVSPECDGLVVSPEFPVFEVDVSRVLPEVLDIYFRMPSIWPSVSGISTGTNVRRRRLHPEAFLAYMMPFPAMQDQQVIREVKSHVDDLRRLHAETAAELDALLPAILDRAFRGEM